MVLRLNGLKFLIGNHHLAKSGGHRLCGSSGIVAKTSYVTLQDHLIKESGDFMEGNSSMYIPTLPKLIAIDVMLIDILLFLSVMRFYRTT